MEFNKMEVLLEKYFEGETSIAEENELKDYFSSSNVAPHLEQYQPLFGYFTEAKEQKLSSEVPLVSKKRKVAWLSIAASIVVLMGVGIYTYFNANTVRENKELGTYDNPEEAFEATQKALAMLSDNVNVGVEGVQYLQVYEVTKDKVFVE
ncbi:hypothetical protein [Flavobacterium granuli]|uniref:Uncharacterized protein n=1 Tax=Flavobacterium granuli TaxID=280093 RepID=A0ABU1S8D4_9FLAO|nr:hypothetical protein [Flavobacterium granuli]MDR6846514.1 hypothetical protein [Flavobacterium granuli]